MAIAAFALQTLQELLSYYPVLLPAVFIFSRGSASSVKIWQAVQRIPHPDSGATSTDKNEKVGSPNHVQNESALKPKRSLKAAALAFLLAFYIVAVLVVPGWLLKGETIVKIFYLCTLSVPIFLLVLSSTLCMGDAIIIIRNAEGKPARLPVGNKGGLTRPLVQSVFSILVTIGALWFGHSLAILVVYSALMYSLTHSKVYIEKTKLKSLFCYALFMGVLVVLLVGMAFVIVARRQKNGITLDDGALYTFTSRGESLVNWKAILIYGSGSIIEYYILSMAYRFDYTNSLAPDFQPLVSVKRNIGFRIPQDRFLAFRDAFPRPYFGSALFSLILAYAEVAALSVAGFVDVTYESSVVVATYLSPVMMFSSMFILAAMKGQFGKLWRYEEDWLAIPTPNEPEASKVDGAERKDEKKDEEKTEEKDLTSFDLDEKEPRGEQNV